MTFKKIYPFPGVNPILTLPYRFQARLLAVHKPKNGPPELWVIPQINSLSSLSPIYDPSQMKKSGIPYYPYLPPPEKIPLRKVPGTDIEMRLLEVDPFLERTIKKVLKHEGWKITTEERINVVQRKGVKSCLHYSFPGENENAPKYGTDEFVLMERPWWKPPTTLLGKFLDSLWNRTWFSAWYNNVLSYKEFSGLYDYWPNLVHNMEIVPGKIGDFYKLKVEYYVPTTFSFPLPRGWLPFKYSLKLQEQFRITDLAGHGKIFTAWLPDMPSKIWAPTRDQLPPQVNPRGIKQEKNAALCNVHFLLKDEKGQVHEFTLEDNYPILVVSHPPKKYLRPDIMRSIVEIFPKENGFEVVRGRTNPRNITAPIPSTYYRYVGGKTLSDLAGDQGVFFDNSFLGHEPLITIEQEEAPGKAFGFGKFKVKATLRKPSDGTKAESFYIPGEYFADQEGKPLLNNRNANLFNIRDIFQHADGSYSEATDRYRPRLVTFEGIPYLTLSRVERKHYQDPEASARLSQITAFFKEKIEKKGLTFVGVAGMSATSPTAAFEVNNLYWVPLNLTKPFREKDLPHVAPLNNFFYFLDPDYPGSENVRGKIKSSGGKVKTKSYLPVKIEKISDEKYKVVNREHAIALEGELFRSQENLDFRLLETPNMQYAVEGICRPEDSSYEAFLYLEYNTIKLKIVKKGGGSYG